MSESHQDTYLGDGVYASYDGFQICNNLIAFYARLFVKVHPQYRFIFNLKRMADEPWHGDMPL